MKPVHMKHTGPISAVATYRSYIATSGYDNRVILWDALTKKPLAQGTHDHLVNHCVFSSDGKLLASASSDYSVRIWQVPSMRLQSILTEHEDDVDMAVFSPDDTLIATCALDKAVRVFDISGQCVKTFLGHTGNIISLLWSEDGRRLISSSVDGSVREWDVDGGVEISCHHLEVRTDTIVIDSLGRIIAGDDFGRIVIISEAGNSYHQAHQAGIKKIVYCKKYQLIASLSYDQELIFWQIDSTGILVKTQRTHIPPLIWARAAALLDGDKLVLGTFGTTYALYDMQKKSWDLSGVEAGDGINAISYHQGSIYTVGDSGVVFKDGQILKNLQSLCNFLVMVGANLYAGGQLGQLFDVKSGEILYKHHSPLNCGVVFYREKQPYIAIGSYTGEMLIFSILADGSTEFIHEIKIYDNAIKGISVNEKYLFSVCASTEIAWHSFDFKLISKITHAHEKIINACCRVGTNRFATVSRDKQLKIWFDGVEESYLSPHLNSIKCLCANDDGSFLLSGSYGGTIAGFDLHTKNWTIFQRPTAHGISSITYHYEQKCFIASSYNGEIYPVSLM